MNKQHITLVKLFVALVLVYWLVRTLDWSLVKEELYRINYWLVGLFLVVQLVGIGLSVKKWQVIARFQKMTFSFKQGYSTYLVGTFLNNFFPSTIGGDIYRSLWLAKKGKKSTAFSTVIFDRVHGLFMTMVMAFVIGFTVWWHLGNLPHFLMLSYLGVFAALGTFIAITFFTPVSALQRLRWSRARQFFEVALSYRQKSVWLEASFWSFLFIVLGLGLSNYVLFLALGYTLPFFPFLGLMCLMALYVSIPLSINNIGIKEWAYGVLLVQLGVSFEAAVTVALLSRLLQTGLSLLSLPAYLLEKKSISESLENSDTLSQNAGSGR